MTRLNAATVIAKKRDGLTLSREEIAHVVFGFTHGTIPEYQMSALAMAIYLHGMNAEETTTLTEEMLRSGQTLAWPPGPPRADKHSTGGIGDKTSLLLAPLLACCGLQVPMISGRGLGPTGGTLDKLESIPGFRANLTLDEVRDITGRVGCVITGASAEIAPADRKLYALRDVTGTVASIPLITASIMSKKLSEGLDALVLDVKTGSGAFMKTVDGARLLAHSLVTTGQRMGVKTSALITAMNQPLGRMAGNALEVNETVSALSNDGPEDLVTLTIALGTELLLATGIATSSEEADQKLRTQLQSGAALEKLRQMVRAQGGDLDAPRPLAPTEVIVAERAGHIVRIDGELLGYAVIELGGGRRVMTDRIDHSVGFEMLVRIGMNVERGQPLLRVFGPPQARELAQDLFRRAITVDDELPPELPLIVERMAGKEEA